MTRSYDTEIDRVMSEQGRMSKWLAAEVGVDPLTVWRWRAGKCMPTEDHQAAIRQALGRNVHFYKPRRAA